MSAIRILKHLDSETLHLPELRSLVGKDVEIVVKESTPAADEKTKFDIQMPPWPSTCKTADQLAHEQGVTLKPIEQMVAECPDEHLFDGLDEAVKKWRQEDSEIEGRRRNASQ